MANKIVDFADRETEKIYNEEFSSQIPPKIVKSALRKLQLIDNASNINDLRSPPGNHLEQLNGFTEPKKYSIRINNQYRICFFYEDGRFYKVQIIDYHC